VAFSPDSRLYVTAGDNGATRLWAVPAPLQGDPERIKLWAQLSTGMEVDGAGAFRPLSADALQQCRERLQSQDGPPLP